MPVNYKIQLLVSLSVLAAVPVVSSDAPSEQSDRSSLRESLSSYIFCFSGVMGENHECMVLYC